MWSVTYELKTLGSTASVIAAVRDEVAAIDKDVPVINVRTQTEQIDATLGQERLFAALTGSFGLLALALASVGVYGVMAYMVARRTSEIGVRMALGAQPWQVLSSILREAGSLAFVGVAAGTIIALSLARLFSSLVYGLTPHDPLTLLSATLLLFAITLVAAWVPAQRASRIDPARALRNE
jgi:ABC-type antimicrobial peptide transport system permease subunit